MKIKLKQFLILVFILTELLLFLTVSNEIAKSQNLMQNTKPSFSPFNKVHIKSLNYCE